MNRNRFPSRHTGQPTIAVGRTCRMRRTALRQATAEDSLGTGFADPTSGLSLIRPVRCFVGDYPANAATRIWDVAIPSRDHVYMGVHHGLPCGEAIVKADVET